MRAWSFAFCLALTATICHADGEPQEAAAPSKEATTQPEVAAEGEVDMRGADIRAVLKASPRDILRLRSASHDRNVAMSQPLTDPNVISDEVALFLTPGEKAPEIFLHFMSPTTILMVDATGQPWPISQIRAVDGALLGASIVENEFANAAVIHNKKVAGAAYFAVFLKDMPKPIMVKATASSEVYTRDKVIKIMETGPLAKVSVAANAAASSSAGLEADPDLNNVLYGVKPFDAIERVVNGGAAQAWEKDNNLLVRTRLAIFSPAIQRAEAGQMGYMAYRLPMTTRIYATNDQGEVVEIKVEQ